MPGSTGGPGQLDLDLDQHGGESGNEKVKTEEEGDGRHQHNDGIQEAWRMSAISRSIHS